jgi:hypothetical protein
VRQPPSLADVLTKLAAAGIAVPPGRVGLDTYGDTPELSHALVALIRDGAQARRHGPPVGARARGRAASRGGATSTSSWTTRATPSPSPAS